MGSPSYVDKATAQNIGGEAGNHQGNGVCILTLARKLEAVHRTTTINKRAIPRVLLAKRPRGVFSPCLISGRPGLSGDSEFSLLSTVTGNVESPLLLGEREDEAVASIFAVKKV